ncbi:23S rRNA (cytidine1920-2'-O)/16S rRNA (cytidine1409-2'-O)-methyltransferase [Antricoccus suffuscus]|uniref:23S rRNA (Cytidine1920-2'-O)/16S rRNA (Cytidine1409-2'-O)-methyltransferase n=1 Tax=Antricoccus suffuscus TaxID=1629062 RepID=A0A2T0ZX65_9ACTN|nr:TlyA family RNA methyltransferase [Antricoccus suffuscus]PRZ40946.1 23S rRNA (cytidine1920-2'-O)/16S rRNA (cytidine1409-2'-O)-methyltransferase [Antricoccus suffuscus]
MTEQKVRLDIFLVRAGMARSRQLARELIASGAVQVGGEVATKQSQLVDESMDVVAERTEGNEFVSRGALKLLGALQDFADIDVMDRRCIDVGASTGGFTEILLHVGAREVVALDVGRDQLDPRLRADDRVHSIERTHVRDVTAQQIGGSGDVVVADLSFISLRHVMDRLAELTASDGVLIPMVKPQFEVGKNRLGKGGVVRDLADHEKSVRDVVASAAEHGLHLRGIARSKVPGPAGNIEYFIRLQRGAAEDFDELWSRVVD